MLELNKEMTTQSGSQKIPVRRSDGSAISSREVTGPDAGASCTVSAGRENTGDGTASNELNNGPPAPQLVERKTELHGLGIAPSREKKSTLRRRTERDLKDPDPEVPYTRFEAAARALDCALMERQDRMNEELFVKFNDLGYRQDDLEATIEDFMQHKRSG